MTEHTSRNSITVSQDEVSFNVLKPSVNMGGVPANGTYSTAAEQASAGSALNAIDIDWNEAKLGTAIQALREVPDNGTLNSTTITTTGELIQVIAKQQKQIDALIVMMKALYGTLQQTNS